MEISACLIIKQAVRQWCSEDWCIHRSAQDAASEAQQITACLVLALGLLDIHNRPWLLSANLLLDCLLTSKIAVQHCWLELYISLEAAMQGSVMTGLAEDPASGAD